MLLRSIFLLVVAALLIATAPGGPSSGQDPQDPIVILPELTSDIRLAVADFTPKTSANANTREALSVFNKVLLDDLRFSGFFEIPARSFYPLTPLRGPGDINFDSWKTPTIDVDFVVFGNLQVDATAMQVEAYLYDVRTQEQVAGKLYTVSDPELARRVAHEFADQVVYQMSAAESAGVARTRIAYASKKGDSKEIYIMDYDGANSRTITANGGLNKFPDWSNDNGRLAYVAKLPSRNDWQLWIQSLEGGHRVLDPGSPFVSSPAFSPNGARVAFAARAAGRSDSDVFVAPVQGGRPRNLTTHPGIDTSPTWSPNGAQIAFISDRTGTPQVWMMDADGSNLQRVVTRGGHCDSPDWSPDGRFILYSWQAPEQYKHDVFIVEVATGRINQLTAGRGSNESPHWSPDGRHIAFQSDRSGRKQIFIMNRDGDNLRQITALGTNESPSWSAAEPIE